MSLKNMIYIYISHNLRYHYILLIPMYIEGPKLGTKIGTHELLKKKSQFDFSFYVEF